MPIDILNKIKDMEILRITAKERSLIERTIIMQSECSEWLELRRSLYLGKRFQLWKSCQMAKENKLS